MRTRVSLLATVMVAGLVTAAPVVTRSPSTATGTSMQRANQHSSNETPVTRAPGPKPTLRLVRKSNRSKPRLVIKGLSGTVTVADRYRVKRGTRGTVGRVATKHRKVGGRGSWALSLRRTTYRVTVRAAGVKTLTRVVPAGRISRTYKFTPQIPDLATDFTRFGSADTFWDACNYKVKFGTTIVTSVVPSNILYYGGNVDGKFASHVKFALAKVTEVTGFRFAYSASAKDLNYLKFKIQDNSKQGGKHRWELSGMAGPGWATYDRGKSRYTGADISLNLMSQAPSNALRRLIMHEVGHAMGLSHAKYKTQVMYSQVDSSTPAWGKGDLAGLRQVANRGCRFKVGEYLS